MYSFPVPEACAALVSASHHCEVLTTLTLFERIWNKNIRTEYTVLLLSRNILERLSLHTFTSLKLAFNIPLEKRLRIWGVAVKEVVT